MMSFCKKSVHSFLGSLSVNNSSSKDNGIVNPPPRCSNIPPPATTGGDGLSLFATTTDIQKPSNILKSAIFRTNNSSTSPLATITTTAPADTELKEDENFSFSSIIQSSTPASATATVTTITDIFGLKKEHGVIGFIDDVGGEIDGLMSCTESLGFESSDERRTEDHIELEKFDNHWRELCIVKPGLTKDMTSKHQPKKKFPPPLSTLNQNGQRSFYLRPVRKEGRLELAEVRIERPEILRASRQDGRLRLQFIKDDEEDDVAIEEEGEENIEKENVEEVNREEDNIEEEKVIIGGEWKFPKTTSGGEGLRRCNESVNHHCHHHLHHHHHNNLHVWSQHSVTIR